MSLLNIENLGLSIHGKPILHGVDLTIDPGQVVAITGESGSGKSLTALSVMQLLPSGTTCTGQITLGGRAVLGSSEATLCDLRGDDMAMVFQEPMTALNPVQTIGDQVAETILIHGGASRAEARTRTIEVLTRVGLPPERFALTSYPHQLSGGQRQRVVIAMAIALRPRLLIADEPTTALDVTVQAQIMDLLGDLVRENGMGMLLITHDLGVVAGRADKIAVMRHGEVVEQGPTEQILRNSQHPYTRMLLEATDHRVSLPPLPAPEPLLSVRKVRRTYQLPRKSLFAPRPSLQAVDGVSFEVHRAERVGLVGESGCGKSTLTRAILGLEAVQSGEITLGGDPVFSGHSANMAVRRKMQVVFQDPYGSFNPRHKVARILAEPFHLLTDPPTGAQRDAVIGAALEEVGIPATAAERYIHEFSGGQRQRIAIARALITKPELIVFDEAVSALDVSVRAQVLDLIADLCRSHGLTYLFISHDLSVVRRVTDRVLVMDHGQIVESGPTEDVFSNPQHATTQALIAAVPRLPDYV